MVRVVEVAEVKRDVTHLCKGAACASEGILVSSDLPLRGICTRIRNHELDT